MAKSEPRNTNEPGQGNRRQRKKPSQQEQPVRVRRRRRPTPRGTFNPDGTRVGYGVPPVRSQFKPGQSGNRKGRPKGRKNFLTEFQEELFERVSISENGNSMKVTKQRALIKALFNRASKGEPKAWDALFKLLQQVGVDEVEDSPKNEDLSPEDQAIMDELLRRLGCSPSQPSNPVEEAKPKRRTRRRKGKSNG